MGLLDRKDKQATPLFIVVMAYITTSGVACLSATSLASGAAGGEFQIEKTSKQTIDGSMVCLLVYGIFAILGVHLNHRRITMSQDHVKIAFDAVMKMSDYYAEKITEEDGKNEVDICEATYNLMRHFVTFLMTNAKGCDAEKETDVAMLEAIKDSLHSFDGEWKVASGFLANDEDRTIN